MFRITLAALACSFAFVGSASAQNRRPDPPPPEPAPADAAPDLNRFRAAYDRAESPNILVMVERALASGAKPAVGENAAVALWDESGDSYLLKASIEDILRKVPEVELVNARALSVMDKRDVELLALSDERAAIALLSKKIDASIVLIVRMQPTRQHGAAYRCTVETIDVPRGRTLGNFGFDWKEDTDAATIKDYATAITRKFIDGFDSAYGVNTNAGTARKYTVKLVGVNIEQLKTAKDAFTAIPGMANVKIGQRQALERGGKTESVTELTISYVGAMFDLAYELQAAAKRALNMDIRDSDLNSGSITLIAREARKAEEMADDERWRTLMDDGKDGERARDNLKSLYRAKASPRIALMINRALTEEELKDPQVQTQISGEKPPILGTSGPVYINIVGDVIGGRAGGGGPTIKPSGGKDNQPATDQLDTERVENELLRRFNTKFNFTMIDPKTARASIQKETEKARRVYEENELVYLLKQQAVAEIVILGVGRIERYGDKKTPVYTFRAVRLSDAAVLSSANVSADKYDFFNNAERTLEAIEDLSKEAAGKLADGLWIKWEPPTPLKVQVQNAKSERDLLRIRDALKDNIPALRRIEFRQFDAGKEGGFGHFDAEYVCSYDDLTRAFIEAQSKLPFELDKSASTQETLTIRIRDSH